MAEQTIASLPAGALIDRPELTPEELQLAVRNHSMPLEALRYDVTPLGLHYLLIHFDIPPLDAASYFVTVGGRVQTPLRLSLADIEARPAKTLAVTLECAGNGRARLSPRPQSQPWLGEAVGTAEWTGTPLRTILDEAGVHEGVTDIVFTGHDRGVQGGIEQHYERSLALADARRDDVLLAYAVNGQPLPPQHGFPLRLVVPGWYGMAHVKWLRSITAVDRSFAGYQQAKAYHFRVEDGETGEPVTRMLPRALMVPPGVPDFMSRTRYVEPGVYEVEGRAWSGCGDVTAVEFSAIIAPPRDSPDYPAFSDGHGGRSSGLSARRSWTSAKLEPPISPHGWRRWTARWDATTPGEYELAVRAADSAGNVQPVEPRWNLEGVMNNGVQRVRVVSASRPFPVQDPADHA